MVGFKWRRRDLNTRPRAYESPALPLSYVAVLQEALVRQRAPLSARFLRGSGARIRTWDLRVMSPTSCHCSTPQRIEHYNVIPVGCQAKTKGSLTNSIQTLQRLAAASSRVSPTEPDRRGRPRPATAEGASPSSSATDRKSRALWPRPVSASKTRDLITERPQEQQSDVSPPQRTHHAGAQAQKRRRERAQAGDEQGRVDVPEGFAGCAAENAKRSSPRSTLTPVAATASAPRASRPARHPRDPHRLAQRPPPPSTSPSPPAACPPRRPAD